MALQRPLEGTRGPSELSLVDSLERVGSCQCYPTLRRIGSCQPFFFLMLEFLTENPAHIHKRDCKYDHDEQDKYQGLEIIKCTFSPFPPFCNTDISES